MKHTKTIFEFDSGIKAVWLKKSEVIDGYSHRVELIGLNDGMRGFSVRCTPSIKHSVRLINKVLSELI
jgi:hypothetical protein